MVAKRSNQLSAFFIAVFISKTKLKSNSDNASRLRPFGVGNGSDECLHNGLYYRFRLLFLLLLLFVVKFVTL
jgi:hypothetical protein